MVRRRCSPSKDSVSSPIRLPISTKSTWPEVLKSGTTSCSLSTERTAYLRRLCSIARKANSTCSRWLSKISSRMGTSKSDRIRSSERSCESMILFSRPKCSLKVFKSIRPSWLKSRMRRKRSREYTILSCKMWLSSSSRGSMKIIIHLKGGLSLTNGVITLEEKFTSSTVSKMSFLSLSGKLACKLLNNTVERNS